MTNDRLLNTLPDDPATLKQMVAQLMQDHDAAQLVMQRRIDDLELSKLRLEMELLKYSERYTNRTVRSAAGCCGPSRRRGASGRGRWSSSREDLSAVA